MNFWNCLSNFWWRSWKNDLIQILRGARNGAQWGSRKYSHRLADKEKRKRRKLQNWSNYPGINPCQYQHWQQYLQYLDLYPHHNPFISSLYSDVLLMDISFFLFTWIIAPASEALAACRAAPDGGHFHHPFSRSAQCETATSLRESQRCESWPKTEAQGSVSGS